MVGRTKTDSLFLLGVKTQYYEKRDKKKDEAGCK